MSPPHGRQPEPPPACGVGPSNWGTDHRGMLVFNDARDASMSCLRG